MHSLQRLRCAQSRLAHSVAPRRALSAFSWGNGNDGQLGHYPEKSGVMNSYTELSPREILSLEGDVVDVACGLAHSAAVLADGRVFTWGKNECGQLGLGPDNKERKSVPIPSEVEALRGVKISQISCGHFHTAAVDEDGVVWTWGYGGSMLFGQGGLGHGNKNSTDLPIPVDVLQEDHVHATAVACGEYHTLALSGAGELWAWGKGEYGRLGVGGASDCPLPELVDIFNEMDGGSVTSIACGQASSYAVTEEGRLFAWGRNDQGQLGLGGGMSMDVYSMEEYPTEVEFNGLGQRGEGDAAEASEGSEGSEGSARGRLRVRSIAGGAGHAVAVTECGLLYQWGMRGGIMAPEELVTLSREGIKVVQASAGSNFSAAVCEDGGVWTWGKGFVQRDLLGHGVKEGKKHPTRIESLREAQRCTKVACGAKHAVVM
jgi:E3 ubiquitin-protein ligase HERC2